MRGLYFLPLYNYFSSTVVGRQPDAPQTEALVILGHLWPGSMRRLIMPLVER